MAAATPPPPWLPPPEQIEAWLGGFRVAYYHESLAPSSHHEVETPVGQPRRWNPALAYAALFDLVGNVLLTPIGPPTGRSQIINRPPPRRRVLVHADAEGVLLRGTQLLEQAGWHELTRAVSHDGQIQLHTEQGAVLAMPHTQRFEPIWRTANHVLRARASHADSMERGLSRPEGGEVADRGLSPVE